MAFSVVMPALEMAQETGKLIAWRKKEGDRVAKGEPLLEIETDKAVLEVEAPADGVLSGIKAAEGAEIPVGQTIAWILAPGEQPPVDGGSTVPAPSARAASRTRTEQTPSSPASPTAISPASPSSRARISPKARRLAKDLGVEIAVIRGSGPGGEILASDVQAAASAATQNQQPLNLETPSTIGRIMAERTTQSWTTIPHFFVSREIDASGLNAYRERIIGEIERANQVRVTHTDILAAVAARVLLKHRRLNASWTSDGIRLHDHVNMGVAMAVNDGVVTAVIPNADAIPLAGITQLRSELAERARTGKLRPADIADATFTISNLGMYKVDQFSAIITPPQAAILAVGSILDKVVPIDGKPAIRPMMTLTISCDHRVADGARAAMFLEDLAKALHDPKL